MTTYAPCRTALPSTHVIPTPSDLRKITCHVVLDRDQILRGASVYYRTAVARTLSLTTTSSKRGGSIVRFAPTTYSGETIWWWNKVPPAHSCMGIILWAFSVWSKPFPGPSTFSAAESFSYSFRTFIITTNIERHSPIDFMRTKHCLWARFLSFIGVFLASIRIFPAKCWFNNQAFPIPINRAVVYYMHTYWLLNLFRSFIFLSR